MNPDIVEFLEALGQWRKASEKLKKSVPDLPTAERTMQNARDRVMDLLQKESVASTIDKFLEEVAPQATAAREEVCDRLRQDLANSARGMISAELRATKPLDIGRKEFIDLVRAYLETPHQEQTLTNSEELIQVFPQLHQAIADRLSNTRLLPRKAKRKRKRRVETGVTMTAIGLGLIASNTQADSSLSVYSYLLGGNALLQAIRDLIGEDASS
ncbi:MAG: hypothetical protein HC925_02815 [Coleofasciculaceae cyanobacterium SM2_3_26]|nr:hypothetical protein [Coleofasciculaceae cyanobacterium SM2_3_26]